MTEQREMTREDVIVEAYEAHDGTVDELVEELGISKQRLYQVLNKRRIVPRTRRPEAHTGFTDVPGWGGDLQKLMAENALAAIFNRLAEVTAELQAYRDKYGPL